MTRRMHHIFLSSTTGTYQRVLTTWDVAKALRTWGQRVAVKRQTCDMPPTWQLIGVVVLIKTKVTTTDIREVMRASE